jgi:hypothetical protein
VSRIDRLIGDRGHGLSDRQREALEWLATGRHGPAPHRQTVDSLERLGAVKRLDGWPVLTGAGRSLAERAGLADLPQARELTSEEQQACADEAAWKRRQDH